jgi:hypothetical protein
MADLPIDPPQLDRRKRTLWLLSGGAASLLLPLAGLAYLHWSDTRPVPGPGGSADVFEHHEGQGPVVPSQAMPNVVAMRPAGGSQKPVSSLDFIRPDPMFATHGPAPAAAAAAAAAPPSGTTAPGIAFAPAASSGTAASQKTAASGKKPFVMPKLQTGRGFMSFGSSGSGSSAAAAPGAAAAGGGQNAPAMQNLPPGAQNNPDVQKYLQSQQGH